MLVPYKKGTDDIVIWRERFSTRVKVRAHVLFFGKVQGVFFRDNTSRKAAELGVTGWVRNLRDGSVEAVMEGPKVRVEDLVTWCQTGQPYAHVTETKISWEEFRGEYSGFSVRR